MSAPASPAAVRRRVPSWFDLRFVLGVLLVLVSVVVGAKMFALADRTTRVWAAAQALAAGTVLTRADLVAVRARLPESSSRYLAAGGPSPFGRPLARDVGSGELLPGAALAGQVCGSEMSIPVSSRHLPSTVRRGSRVDVFATATADHGGETAQVLNGVTVQAVVGAGSALASSVSESALVVRVAGGLAADVVAAMRSGEIDVVVVDGPRSADGCGRSTATIRTSSPTAGDSPGEVSPSAAVPSASASGPGG
jgi:hypothetical protein